MLRFFFFLSLTFNIVIIGAVSAYLFREPRLLKALPPVLHPHLPQPHNVTFKRIELALPKEKAAFAARELRAMKEKMRGHRRRMPELQQKIRVMLAAEVFAPEAIRAAHQEMQQGRADISEEFTETLLRIAEGLTLKERQALVKAFPKHKGRSKRRHGRHRRGNGDRPDHHGRRGGRDIPLRADIEASDVAAQQPYERLPAMTPIIADDYTPIPEPSVIED